jgi:hypothetical protein
MTQWNPVWKVELDGVEYTNAVLANLSIRSGRTNIYEQAQAGYVNLELLDVNQTTIPVSINSTISVQIKDTSNTFISIFGGNVVDVVGFHPTGGAVVKEEVITLVLQKAEDLRVAECCQESGIPVEVEVRILDTDPSRRDLLVPDLGDRPDEVSEEGLREEHADEVGLQIEGIPFLLGGVDSVVEVVRGRVLGHVVSCLLSILLGWAVARDHTIFVLITADDDLAPGCQHDPAVLAERAAELAGVRPEDDAMAAPEG